MPDPSNVDRSANRRRDPQYEVGLASWLIVGLFAVGVMGLAVSGITSPRSDRTAVAANRSAGAPAIAAPPLVIEDETTGQAQSAR
jgi:hypothetical protein